MKTYIQSSIITVLLFASGSVSGGPTEPEDFAGFECPENFSESQPEKSNKDFFRVPSVLSAPIATLVSAVFTYPLDLKKLRLQSGIQGRSHYKGLSSYSIATVTSIGTTLTVYDIAKEKGYSDIQSGLAGGFLSQLLSTPFWVFRTKVALQANSSESYLKSHYLQEINKNPGVAYRGQIANLGVMTSQGLYFYSYGRIKHHLKQIEPQESEHLAPEEGSVNLSHSAIAGGTSKLIVSMGFYPLDTIRLLRQQSGETYLKIFEGLSAQGLSRFYKGFAAHNLKSCIGTVIQMPLYEWLKKDSDLEPQ